MRIASREELKMEINKYKSISTRLLGEMKRNSLKVPAYATRGANLDESETGLREMTAEGRSAMGTGGA